MKKILALIVFSFTISTTSFGQRNCGSVYDQTYINSLPATVKDKLKNFNTLLEENNGSNSLGTFSATSTINSNDFILVPVVVHVVWNTNAQNISDAQICSQITVMNEDFNRRNLDAVNTPGAFTSSASNTRFQFYLATVDPNGNPTNGVTRTNTATASFIDNNNVKFNTTGGHDAWPADRYLNLWVSNLGLVGGGQLLGYAQFPEDLSSKPNTDGVVIHWQAFGRGAGFNLMPKFNLGRTATHEIGHWMGLIHIWGDDNGACSGTDQIVDTPNQGNSSLNVPTFPTLDNCSTTNPGIMFMNYMDYTDDVGMNLFTGGQSSRMRANFNPGGFRQNAAYAIGVPIAGTEPVCTTSTFSIPGLPNSYTVTNWSSSNTSALTFAANVATRQNNYNGVVTITATVTSTITCSTFIVTKSIIVGTGISDPLFEQKTIVCTSGSQYSILARVTQAPGAATYKWYIGSSTGTNFVLKNTTTSNSATVGGGNPDNLYHTLKVDITNACNLAPISTANPEGRYKASCAGGGGGTFSIFPNPASTELSVEFIPDATASSTLLTQSTETISTTVGLIEFSVKLVNSSSQTVVTGNSQSGKISIDTHNLQPGIYYLHINKNGEITTEQILIKK